jgi:argininosuccinate lyase
MTPRLARLQNLRLTASAALLLGLAASSAAAQQKAPRDTFFWMSEINKASSVMVVETGIVPKALGQEIARALGKVIQDQASPGSGRPGDVIEIEKLLAAIAGPDVSRIHSGRSRKDIGATRERMALRESVLETLEAVNRARAALLKFAEQDPNAIIPAYTEGVQAQPVTLGHHLTAYSQALSRAAERLKFVCDEVNQSPMGSAALGTSSFPIDRRRLADLLGFEGIVENSMDATLIADNDTGAMAAGVANSIALTIGRLVSDIASQYRMTQPWLLLSDDLTTASSIMPQKRNPDLVNDTQRDAGEVFALYNSFVNSAYNIPIGLLPNRSKVAQSLKQTTKTLNDLTTLFQNLALNKDRALAEVKAEYSTATELADVLQREANVPFRVGHHFASLVVTFGRRNNLAPAQIPYAEAKRLFAEAADAYKISPKDLPLTEPRFQQSLSPESMVNASKGLGGPQPDEVARMIAEQKADIAADQKWVGDKRAKLAAAADALNAAFEGIRAGQ